MGALSMMRSRPRVSPIHMPARTNSTKSSSLGGAPAARNRLLCWALLGDARPVVCAKWQPAGQRQRRPGA
jgi:hypothetical protein